MSTNELRKALEVIASIPMAEQDNMVSANMRDIARDALAAPSACSEPQPVKTLTDVEVYALADVVVANMPDGLQGFLKTWGWQQFAYSLFRALHGYVPASPAACSEPVNAGWVTIAQVIEAGHDEPEARIRWLLNPMPVGSVLYELVAAPAVLPPVTQAEPLSVPVYQREVVFSSGVWQDITHDEYMALATEFPGLERRILHSLVNAAIKASATPPDGEPT